MGIKNLNPRQKKFLAEYLKNPNATQAALKAGYSKTSARESGSELLTHSIIRAAVEKKFNKLDISADRILEELAAIAFADLKDFVVIEADGSVRVKTFNELPDGASRVIEGIEEVKRVAGENAIATEKRLRYKHHPKIKALELLGKFRKLFTDQVEVSGQMGVALITDEQAREMAKEILKKREDVDE